MRPGPYSVPGIPIAQGQEQNPKGLGDALHMMGNPTETDV